MPSNHEVSGLEHHDVCRSNACMHGTESLILAGQAKALVNFI